MKLLVMSFITGDRMVATFFFFTLEKDDVKAGNVILFLL